MRVIVANALLFFLIFSSITSFPLHAQSPAADADKPVRQGTIQRKVLIFDFENQTGKIGLDYLSGSISDALADAIKKTGKFRLLNREDARMNSVADSMNPAPGPAATESMAPAVPAKPATPNAPATSTAPATPNTPPASTAPATPNSSAVSPPAPSAATTTTEQKPANNAPKDNTATPGTVVIMNVKVARKEAIRKGREAGADVVVLGKFSELNGVLLMSAQAFEADTRQLKVSEEVLSKSDSEMFNGINILAAKIAESMARELPMFDAAEAERRRAEAAGIKAEPRDWEIQLFGGMPLLHPLYSSDGTITYSKGIPVQKLTGYSVGVTLWESGFTRKIGFMPKGARFGLQSKVTPLTGQADIVGTNSLVLTQGATLSGVFVSNHLLFGFPYWQWNRFVAFAEVGGGTVYTRLATTDSTIFSSWQPSAVIGTSGAYHFSYWSLGLTYRAQVTFFLQNQAFMQHDLWLYAGVRL